MVACLPLLLLGDDCVADRFLFCIAFRATAKRVRQQCLGEYLSSSARTVSHRRLCSLSPHFRLGFNIFESRVAEGTCLSTCSSSPWFCVLSKRKGGGTKCSFAENACLCWDFSQYTFTWSCVQQQLSIQLFWTWTEKVKMYLIIFISMCSVTFPTR